MAQAEFDSKTMVDRAKRFEFLISQADIFAHFISDKKATAPSAIEGPNSGPSVEMNGASSAKKRGRPKKAADTAYVPQAGAEPSFMAGPSGSKPSE